jgi:hypothetical protein
MAPPEPNATNKTLAAFSDLTCRRSSLNSNTGYDDTNQEIPRMSQYKRDDPTPIVWCHVCGTAHSGAMTCPGALVLTGEGETVWQSWFKTTGGETAFLITRTAWSDRWCARIFTDPYMPWSIPGGGAAIKFLSESPEECKDAAVRYLIGFCEQKGYIKLGEKQAPAGEPAQGYPVRAASGIPLIWGTGYPSNPGASLNVSTTGMFVATELPPEPGTMIKIRLKLGALSLPLRGRVAWKREAPDPGRRLEAGMGIHLLSPPSIYKGYIQQFI